MVEGALPNDLIAHTLKIRTKNEEKKNYKIKKLSKNAIKN